MDCCWNAVAVPCTLCVLLGRSVQGRYQGPGHSLTGRGLFMRITAKQRCYLESCLCHRHAPLLDILGGGCPPSRWQPVMCQACSQNRAMVKRHCTKQQAVLGAEGCMQLSASQPQLAASPADHNGLLPARHQPGNVFNDDGLPEDCAIQDVPAGRREHHLERRHDFIDVLQTEATERPGQQGSSVMHDR